ncbi:MAG: response regulator transcription factor [Actinomycetaceae bacterium]|nr:response regulator transcription factor [Actinomycetaceae bacterium]MDU0970239.1 response regulator transcription factor [Actinomycetaceae bacterium]
MRLVLADDSGLIRGGLAGLLTRQGFEVAGQTDSADTLVPLVDDLVAKGTAPDVVITDVRMPPRMRDDGLEAAIELRDRHPAIGLIVLSQYVSPLYATKLFEAPGDTAGTGYLLKDHVAHVADFIRAIDVVASGGVVVDPEVTTAMLRSGRLGLTQLTRRENEVLDLMAQGRSNSEIAAQLVLSEAAIAKHVSSIFAKLGLDPGQDNRRVRAILLYLAQRRAL